MAGLRNLRNQTGESWGSEKNGAFSADGLADFLRRQSSCQATADGSEHPLIGFGGTTGENSEGEGRQEGGLDVDFPTIPETRLRRWKARRGDLASGKGGLRFWLTRIPQDVALIAHRRHDSSSPS